MNTKLRVIGEISVLKLFICVIALPTILVMITICNMGRENHEHKVTHEVYFEIDINGKPEGRMVFGLFGETVPLTVKNFYTFATDGYNGYKYEGTIFHRVIKKFMIQGGDVFHENGTGTISIYGKSFPDENFDIHHATSGFLSMANGGKDTNGCQFFLTTLSTPWLDGSHVAFGKVIEGQSILHKIEYLPTDNNDKPIKTARIRKSGTLPVKKPYWLSDDPYNLKDWLKTISFPLGLSFSIILLFNHFINKIDKYISTSEEFDRKISEANNSKEFKKVTDESEVKRRKSEVLKTSVSEDDGLRHRKRSIDQTVDK